MRDLERVVGEQVASVHVGLFANGGVLLVSFGAYTVADAEQHGDHGDQHDEQAHPERDGQDEQHRRRILDGAYKTYVHTVETARQPGGGRREAAGYS